ncbi:hypothetical protein TraAM80_00217 [Trypanosoma rangeli]|uniref:Uncharacterized protein n=1 Tax=Trypanosoma rangeli TaxID=5698 RepID=A0A3S5ISQ2_TRYRA|nr:uncharacterized protein TraAM80_00217 [Trypanosoma rangeli]RNF12672.1 hypothetical protein TraAM80_00217 [Trypanosoma rangeli]|eukprot:RNF12672.1 hypothetical protein TraAM80_00217 [Trypanosoma rangeli]
MNPLARALQLQHTRCEVYHLWDAKFHLALSGALSAADLSGILNDTIITAFQQVSSSLRQLQDAVRGETGAEGDEAAALQFLDAWIDRLQRIEQEHYHTSVRLSQRIAEHCTAMPPAQPGTRETATTCEVTTDVVQGSSVKATPTEHRGPCASLHDAELCLLRQLVPMTTQKAFKFVSCRDATSFSSDDEDGNAQDECGGQEANNAIGEEEQVSFMLPSGVAAVYAPRRVRQCCQTFNEAVLPLWSAKRSLMQQLQEWTEELQAELASVAAPK